MKLFTECPTPKEETNNLMEFKLFRSSSTRINHLNLFLLLTLDLQQKNLLWSSPQVYSKILTMKKMLEDKLLNKLAIMSKNSLNYLFLLSIVTPGKVMKLVCFTLRSSMVMIQNVKKSKAWTLKRT